MYNPNVPSSNMGIAPISGQPSQPLGPAPMGAPPPMAPPMMGGMPPPPMMAPPPMAPPIAPITEGLGGFGGSSAGRAGFSERMQRMTAPPKPKPQPMPVQRMNMGGAVSSQGLSMYQPPMMPRPMGMMGGVPNGVEPLRMALGGFIGNPTTREYNYTDPYEGLDDLHDDIGGYDPSDPFGDGDPNYGGDDDDRNFGPPVPTPAPPVSPPSGGDDIKDSVVADLVYDSADPTVGPNNAQEALDQALADFKAGRGDVADLTLSTLASRIGLGSDVMPARLSDIAAISQDFAVEDTTFPAPSDPDEIFDLSNPISLEADLTTPTAPKMALPGGSAIPNDIQLEMAQPTGGGLAGASTRPGMGSDDPIVYNDTPSGPVFTRPDGTVSTPADSAAISAQARLDANSPTGFDTMALEEAAYPSAFSDDMQPVDDMQIVGATRAALKRAEDDVSALDRIAEARMPTDDMQIVDDMRSVPRSSPEFAAPVGDLAQFEPQVRAASSQTATADPSVVPASFTNVDPYEDQSVKDSYYDQLFGDSPKPVQLLGNTLKFLSSGLIDINKLNESQRQKGLEAFAKTNELAYETALLLV